MNNDFYTNNGMKVYMIPSAKFKTIHFSLKWMNVFKEDTINKRALLPQILLSGSKNYPNKKDLQQAFDSLYGMDISASTRRIGNISVVAFDMMVVNPKYLTKDNTSLHQSLSLFKDILINPVTRNQQFLKRVVEEEKRLLTEDLMSIYHDKQEYSFELFKKVMFPNELYELNPKGILDAIDKEDSTTLSSYYQTMKNSDSVELYVIGDFDNDEMKNIINQYFPFKSSHNDLSFIDFETKEIKEVAVVKENGDIKQTRLTIGYRTNIRSKDRLFYAISIMNILFGESDQSILFQNIREEHQLSYYVSSTYVASKGVVFVFAGIGDNQAESVSSLVANSLQKIQNGEFNDEEIEIAKKLYLSRAKKSNDSIGSLIGRNFMSLKLDDEPYDFIKVKQKIDKLTKTDIVEAANTLILDTIHVYEAGGDKNE